MEKNDEIMVIEKTAAKDDEGTIIKLSRTYQFEGEVISQIDMSGMEDITANDMIKANKVLNSSGNVSVVPEANLEYALVIASSATGMPIEFFKGLAPRDAIRVKNKVTSFFFGEE